METETDQTPGDRGAGTSPTGRWGWLWVALFVVSCGSGGAVSFLVGGDEPFTGRWWLIMGSYLVVAAAVGVGMGLVLRRRLGWRSSAWAARRKQLSWRQRLRIGWATERARAVEDPDLARAAVERGEFGLQVMARLEQWYVLAARGTAGLGLLFAAALVALAVWGWDNSGEDWAVVAIAVGLVVLAASLPWLYRRMWGWVTRRAEKALAENRAVAARAGGGDR